jgi:protein-tyrosine phosphatase
MMTDIHSHILWGVDDGPPTLDEAVRMCKESAADGISCMVATPHAFDGVHTTHDSGFLQERVTEMNDQLGGSPIVKLGCELRMNHDIVRQVCADRTAPTLGGGPYVLIEFPHYVVPIGSDRVFFELMTNGFKPIIAHPERNRTLMAEPEKFHKMVDNGVLGQMDSGSITGQFGVKTEKTVRLMLEHGLIHFIASDCHNMRNRLPGLSKAIAEVAEFAGEDVAKSISIDNPGAIVEGKPLPWRPTPVLPEKGKKWWFFNR